MYGLIPQKRYKVADYHFRGISGIVGGIVNQTGDWSSYLPIKEYQYGTFFDSMACVTFSALNCLEILFQKQYGLSYNFSDRYIAKLSNTTERGNYLYKVADAIRKYGLVREEEWKFDRSSFNREVYYADIPPPLIANGQQLLLTTTIQYEFINPLLLENALYEAPLQITITYPSSLKNGVYERLEGPEQHAVCLFNRKEGEWWEIFDTYDDTVKRLAWDYKFFTALKFHLSQKQSMAIPSNTLIQLVEGKGDFGLLVGEKLYVDDLAKITASWLVRNNGKVENKVRAVNQTDWDSFQKFDLKNNPLT